MTSGHNIRTTNHSISYYWPTYGSKHDDTFARKVGVWIAKNEKVLDKTLPVDCCKLLAEEFPPLTLIEIKGAHGWLGRWAS